MRYSLWPSLQPSGNTLPKSTSCTAMGIIERRHARGQRCVTEFLFLSMMGAQVLAEGEAPDVLVNKRDFLPNMKRTEEFAPGVMDEEDTEGGIDVDVDSGPESGSPGTTSGWFVFLLSTLCLTSLADDGWLVEVLPEATVRSDAFRDETELEFASGDTFFDNFFSTKNTFLVVPPEWFCLALEDAVLPSKGLATTGLPGDCSAFGLAEHFREEYRELKQPFLGLCPQQA